MATDAVGNLFLPGDKFAFNVTVEAVKPLGKDQQLARYSVRDYWGAQQMAPGEVALQKAPRKERRFVYTAKIEVPGERLAVGRYCELHVEIPQETGEPVREFSGLAILPPAPARNCEPEQVPFTIRNWDSRVPVYFRLADRLGLRMMGVWGGWSSKPPYKPHCPGVELCAELGAKWITGTPASTVERKGFTEYGEDALRAGMRNFLQQYADRGMAMIAMGNEPHGTGQKVLDNVRAYKAIYETVKAFDPGIHVIGVSVEPNARSQGQGPRPIRRLPLRPRLQVQPVQPATGRRHLLQHDQRYPRQEVRGRAALSRRGPGLPVSRQVGQLPASAVARRWA